MTRGPAGERWTFGEAPLEETRELAAVLRDLMGSALALEHPVPELQQVVRELRAARERLASLAPADLRPRIGDAPDPSRRVYLDHSRDVGDYNACFPVYEMRAADDHAEGRVTFPVVYEGPPGIVHGGFLAVFFDCALQQLSCDMGAAGKTRSLSLRFRRPVPILTELVFAAHRRIVDGVIRLDAELRLDGATMCTAEMDAVLGDRDTMPAVSARRSA